MVLLPIKHYTTLPDGSYSSELVYQFVKITEKWKELYFKGKPSGYTVSNLGNVRKPDGSPSPLYYDKDGYTRFCLYIPKNNPVYKNKKRIAYPYKTHRAVAELFVVNKDPGKKVQVMHLNDIPSCNIYLNLRWGTPLENMNDKKFSGRSIYLRGEEKKDAMFSEKDVHNICRKIYIEGITSSTEIIKSLGLENRSSAFLKSYKNLIANVKRGHCWKYIRDEYYFNYQNCRLCSTTIESIIEVSRVHNKYYGNDKLLFL